MIILGIGGILGDAASAILKDGALVAAVEESKLVRRRTYWGGPEGLPEHSIATCLELAGARVSYRPFCSASLADCCGRRAPAQFSACC